MTIRTYEPCTIVQSAHPHQIRYSVRNNAGALLASMDTEAEAESAKRAFETVLLPRFTRDEAIALVVTALEPMADDEGLSRDAVRAVRAALEALAAAGVFSVEECDPRGCTTCAETMAGLLDAAGIR